MYDPVNSADVIKHFQKVVAKSSNRTGVQEMDKCEIDEMKEGELIDSSEENGENKRNSSLENALKSVIQETEERIKHSRLIVDNTMTEIRHLEKQANLMQAILDNPGVLIMRIGSEIEAIKDYIKDLKALINER